MDPDLRDALEQLATDLRAEIRSGDAETRPHVEALAVETRRHFATLTPRSVQLHDLAEGGPQIVPGAAEMWMHGERPAEELGGLTELAERHMAQSLA